MADGTFVAYYRVSTDKQGRSGLGIEAQQSAVETYLNGGSWHLAASFTEIESGKRNDRPKLEEALTMCRLLKARLVIARLDRLSRNASFLLNLQASGVRFVAADMPYADEFTVGVLAMVAQKEREMISQRTKDALAAARRRGVKLGGDRGHLHTVQRKASAAGVAARNAKADAHAADLAPIIKEQMSLGQSLRSIAQTLNDKGIPTPQGSTWTAAGVSRVIKRLGL